MNLLKQVLLLSTFFCCALNAKTQRINRRVSSLVSTNRNNSVRSANGNTTSSRGSGTQHKGPNKIKIDDFENLFGSLRLINKTADAHTNNLDSHIGLNANGKRIYKQTFTITSKNRKSGHVESLQNGTVCWTPNKIMGLCVPITECKILLNAINKKESRTFILSSRCDLKNKHSKDPKVCCGKYSNFVPVSPWKPYTICGHQKPLKSRIYGGKEAAVGEFPWLARIIHKKPHSSRRVLGCTGFLIHPRYVVTAAHCIPNAFVVDNIGNITYVELGEHNSTSKRDCPKCANTQRINVNYIVKHPGFDSAVKEGYNDIAIIELERTAKFTDFVQPICLSKSIVSTTEYYWVSGWGKTEKTVLTSEVKMKLMLPAFNFSKCRELYGRLHVKLQDTQICAGGEKLKDSCTGDSGGPLMSKVNDFWYAFGVVSFGLGCGREGWPGIYTNLPLYYDWILKQIRRVNNQRRLELRKSNFRQRSSSI